MDSEDIKANFAGKIKSVSCKNFVTYDECVMYPTEYLNVIIGPNGTGKSTLVSAIVLGMGGTAKLLSRAAGIQDYIKNGCTEAVVEIEIYVNHQKETKKFQRRFDSLGKSEFQINEAVVSHKNYLQAISEFNIQVDNLCQFLPQDRVQDFAKMNPQELLNNTISSVCKQEVVDKFAKLKDLRKKQLNTKKSLSDDIRRLNELKHRNEELKQILDRIAAKKEFAETINICQAKKLWIEVKELKEKATEVKSNLNDAEKIVAERQSRYNKLRKDQGGIVKKTSELADFLQKQGNIVSTLMQKIDEIIGSIENLESQIRRAKQEFETSKREQEDRETEIYNESKALNDANEELKKAVMDVGSDADRSVKLQVIRENLSRFKVEISTQMAKRSEINKKLDEDYVAEMQVLKQRIQSMESMKELRLKLLENKFPDQYRAVMWLRRNLDKFRGRIYEPMILELNVKDAKNAKYFENSIPLRDLLAFTCENKTDMSELIEYLSIEQQLSINIVYSAPATVCQYVPNTQISAYSNYGFFAYLIELIDGPPAILNYLCRLYQLEKILIGTDKVNDCIDSIPNNIRNYYGGDTKYNVIISKYSGEPVRSQTKIRDRNLLSGVDRAELNALKKRYADKAQAADLLRNERSQIEAKTDELEHQRGEVMKEQRSLEMVMSKLRELKERVAKQARRVKQLKTARVDINLLQETFKERTKRYIKEILEQQMARVNCISEFQQALQEKECATIRVNTYKLENEELTRTINEATDVLVQGKRTLDNVKVAMENAAKKYRLKLVEAKNLTNGLKPSDAQFPYVKEFAELSDDIEDLKAIINDTTARLECLGENDKNVTEEYERRNAQIEALSNIITDAQNGDEGLKNEITVLYESWIPELNRVVDILNRNFGNFMNSMDYVGEVLLFMKEEMDFDSYGIQIMVQYRNGAKLQALDRYVQSGGERAVAIAIYTLSLQQLTHVPFRCVDEINQGMDPRNERKIFDMLVEETTKFGSSQYFFVTPKLLPNLKCNDRMTVHVVFNGKFVKPKNAFDFIF